MITKQQIQTGCDLSAKINQFFKSILDSNTAFIENGRLTEQGKTLYKRALELENAINIIGSNLDLDTKNTFLGTRKLIAQLSIQGIRACLLKYVDERDNKLEAEECSTPLPYPKSQTIKHSLYRDYLDRAGLFYVRKHLYPDAWLFMKIHTIDGYEGILVGFKRRGDVFKALVRISDVTYLLNLNQIVWPISNTKDLPNA